MIIILVTNINDEIAEQRVRVSLDILIMKNSHNF